MSAVVLRYVGSPEDEAAIGGPDTSIERLILVEDGVVWLPVSGMWAEAAERDGAAGRLAVDGEESVVVPSDWLRDRMGPNYGPAVERIAATALRAAVEGFALNSVGGFEIEGATDGFEIEGAPDG